jgi:hypothetical protein
VEQALELLELSHLLKVRSSGLPLELLEHKETPAAQTLAQVAAADCLL